MALGQHLSATNSVLAPLHLLSYSTLLGMQLWQSFAVTKIAFISLPRSAFTTINKRIFRVYFLTQAILIFTTAVTIPSSSALPALFPSFPLFSTPAVGDGTTNTSIWITFAVLSMTSLLNLIIWEPRSRQAMVDRIHQETRDGRKAHDPEPTPQMQAINRRFKRSHAMCIHLNLVTIGATLFWGWKIASCIRL